MVSKNITLLKWYNFFYDFRPYEAIAVLYYAQVTGSFALGIAIFSIASIAASVFEVPTGIISDRIGRRRTIILGSISSALAIALYAVGGSFAILALGAAFNGLTRAFLSGNNDALLYDTLHQMGKKDAFAEKLGKVSSMFEIGLGVSALLAAGLAFMSLQAVVIASILPQVICAIIAFKFIEPKVHTNEIQENVFAHLKEAMQSFKKNRLLRRLSMASILDYAIGETFFQFKPAFLATLWPTWALGLSRTIDHLLGFFGYHFAGRLIKKFGAFRTLVVLQVLDSANNFVAAGIPSVASPLIQNVNSFFFGVGETARGTLFQKEFTDKQRATMGSLNAFAGSIAFAIISFGVGLIADYLSPATVILILAAMSLVVLGMYINLHKKHSV